MAAPAIALYPQYNIPDLNGSRSSPAVFNLSGGGTVPKVIVVLGDPDGDLQYVWARFYTRDGRYLFNRVMTQNGTFNGTPLWEYQLAYNLASVNTKKYIQFGGPGVTGGSFQIEFNQVRTEAIAGLGLTASRIQAAMERHPDIGPGNILVTAGPEARRFTFEFIGNFAHCASSWSEGFRVHNALVGGTTLTAGTSATGTSDISATQQELFWDAVGVDATQYSGGKPTLRSALGPAKSQLFVDFPTSFSAATPANDATVTTPFPTFTWTYTTGTILSMPVVRHTISIYEINGGVVAEEPVVVIDRQGGNLNSYGSVTLSGAAQQLRDGQEYRRVHEVTKRSGAKYTVAYDFTVDYPRPIMPSARTLTIHPDNAYVGATWTPTSTGTVSEANWIAYVAKVRPASEPETSDKNIEIWRNPYRARNYAFLPRIPKNMDVILSFYVEQYQFGEPVLSQAREYPLRLDIKSAMIINPLTLEYVLLDTYDDERDVGYLQPTPKRQPWGLSAPVAVFGGPKSREVNVPAVFEGSVAAQRAWWEQIQALYLNAAGYPLVYTDADGEMIECVMDNPRKSRRSGWPTLLFCDIHAEEVSNESRYW
jgi:hypothetical protein